MRNYEKQPKEANCLRLFFEKTVMFNGIVIQSVTKRSEESRKHSRGCIRDSSLRSE